MTQNQKGPETVSFINLYDSIKTLDSVTIVFKTKDGKLIDTVFRGRFVSKADFQNLPVETWDGGKAIIMITAYEADEIVYRVDKHFDGTTDITDTTFVIISTSTSLEAANREIAMIEGDSLPLFPLVIAKPAT